MKIRKSYVSNSSSSSFIVYGKNIGKFYDLGDLDVENKQYFLMGNILAEGVDLMELTVDMYDYFCQNHTIFDYGDVLEYHHVEKNDETLCVPIKLPFDLSKDSEIIVVDVDYHRTSNIEEAEGRYSMF